MPTSRIVRRRFGRLSLDVKLIASYLVILGVGGLAISVVGSWIVSRSIWHEAQRTVSHDLAIARSYLDQRLEAVARAAASGALLVEGGAADGEILRRLEEVREGAGLELLGVVDAAGRAHGGAPRDLSARLAVRSALGGRAAAGLELVPLAELAALSPRLAERARVEPVATRHATPPDGRAGGAASGSGLLLVAAAPVRGVDGAVTGAVWGVILVDRGVDLVDRLWRRLYGEGAGPGALTLFRGDLRVATTLRGADGRRAIGTRVSDEVRAAVLERGETWRDRAFVVDAWYISAYEPLRDLAGTIVGMLYVGLPEATYAATRNRVISSFFAIATLGFALVLAFTYWTTQGLTRPIRQMVEATRSVAAGRFDHPLEVAPESDLGQLAVSFGQMQSSLRRMHGDLEEAARTLEDKVRARTDELARMQVRMAQSERLASIGLLAAGVAHEINNPLGGILALTSLALEDLPPGDPRRENLEEVVRQTLRCGEIVRHLLEFSRQHRLSAQPLDLDELLERTLSLLERQSMFFNVRVERDFEPGLPKVVADGSQLQQVFMNILLNAVQAMDGHGTITVSSRLDAARDVVALAFRDTGCGIAADQIDRVFDPFFTTKGDEQGTGLGLSIAYGIVHRHRGTITVESEVGVGTTFTVRLPLTATRNEPSGGDVVAPAEAAGAA